MGVGAENNAGTHVAPNGRVRIFWGNSGAGHDGPANNPDVSIQTANSIIAGAQVNATAMRAAMPSAWQGWYDGLSSSRQADIYASLKAHPGYVT